MKSSNTSIRRANVDDAGAIAELAAEVQKLHHDSDPDSYNPPDPTTALRWFRDVLGKPDTVAFIAEDGEQSAVGYVITFPRSVAGNPIRRASEFVELNEIGVAASCRGQGIGRALHDRVVDHWTAAGAKEIHLTVIAFNTDARRYYEHLGFEETSRRMALRLT